MMIGKLVRLLVLCFVGIAAVANATPRVIETFDGSVVKVSADEPNLIEAKHGRISSFVFSEGKFSETIDEQSGVVYFLPLEEGPRSGFVEVVDDDNNRQRFNLILVPEKNQTSQRIVLLSKDEQEEPIQVNPVPVTSEHIATLKQFIRAMLQGSITSQPIVEVVSYQVDKLRITPITVYERNGLQGQLVNIKNTDSNDAQVQEHQLHIANDLVAIVVPKRNLGPQQSVIAYFVRFSSQD